MYLLCFPIQICKQFQIEKCLLTDPYLIHISHWMRNKNILSLVWNPFILKGLVYTMLIVCFFLYFRQGKQTLVVLYSSLGVGDLEKWKRCYVGMLLKGCSVAMKLVIPPLRKCLLTLFQTLQISWVWYKNKRDKCQPIKIFWSCHKFSSKILYPSD